MKIRKQYRDYFMIMVLGYIVGKTSNQILEAIALMILLSVWIVIGMYGG